MPESKQSRPSRLAASGRVLTAQLGGMVIAHDREVVLKTPMMGSSAAIAILDEEAGIGGLLHFALPDADGSQRGQQQPELFADTGLKRLLARLDSLPTSRNRLRGHLIGGADSPIAGDGVSAACLGVRNLEAARRALREHEIEFDDGHTGGHHARRVAIDMQSSRVRVTEQPGGGRG